MLISQDRRSIQSFDGGTIHVLKSKWHAQYVDSLVARFQEDIAHAGNNSVIVHTISGCLEMPLSCIDLHRRYGSTIEAYVCFGVLMKGETAHFEMIMNTVTAAFANIITTHEIAVVNCIIPANRIEEVATRSENNEFNKGSEAALATAEIIHWRRSINRRT